MINQMHFHRRVICPDSLAIWGLAKEHGRRRSKLDGRSCVFTLASQQSLRGSGRLECLFVDLHGGRGWWHFSVCAEGRLLVSTPKYTTESLLIPINPKPLQGEERVMFYQLVCFKRNEKTMGDRGTERHKRDRQEEREE